MKVGQYVYVEDEGFGHVVSTDNAYPYGFEVKLRSGEVIHCGPSFIRPETEITYNK